MHANVEHTVCKQSERGVEGRFANKVHTICTQHTDQMQNKCIPFWHTNNKSRYYLAHLHQLVVSSEWPAVDKLLSVEVLVPNFKAAEDLNLRQLAPAPAALGTRTLLQAQH
jgi:hypothetical protein